MADRKRLFWIGFSLLALAIGFGLRLAYIGQYPLGLNQDEASVGYDAYSLLFYGVCRNLKSYPVQFISWGSGQNALYSYLCMPFIRIFGLNEFSIRFPMALFSCLLLVSFFFLLKSRFGLPKAAVGVLLLAINPWDIMRSRWALESNLLPSVLLLGALLIIAGHRRNRILFYLGFAVLGLSAYAYGTTYLFLPVFFAMFLTYMTVTKMMTLKEALIGGFLAIVVAFPMILFAFINYFKLPEIKLLFLTIPRLNDSRMDLLTSLHGNIPRNLLTNFLKGLRLLVFQNDDMLWNSTPEFGLMYLISPPLILLGILSFCRNKKKSFCDMVFFLWLVSSFILLFLVVPNVNRINVIFYPLCYFLIMAVFEIFDRHRRFLICLIASYGVCAFLFVGYYFGAYQKQIMGDFHYSLGEAIQYAEQLDYPRVYMTDSHESPYIYVLFYTQPSPYEYVSTVDFTNPGGAYENVEGLGDYIFHIPALIDPQEDACYIVAASNIDKFSQEDFSINRFQRYAVVTPKNPADS